MSGYLADRSLAAMLGISPNKPGWQNELRNRTGNSNFKAMPAPQVIPSVTRGNAPRISRRALLTKPFSNLSNLISNLRPKK
jgi:hypothetical protein